LRNVTPCRNDRSVQPHLIPCIQRTYHTMASTINTAYRSISGSAYSHGLFRGQAPAIVARGTSCFPAVPLANQTCQDLSVVKRCFPAMLHSPRLARAEFLPSPRTFRQCRSASYCLAKLRTPSYDLHDVFRRCSLGIVLLGLSFRCQSQIL
jgi:hypothetical protein